MTRRNLRLVLLDVDGTLVDSNDAHARTWVEALVEHDFEPDVGAIRRFIGMGGNELMTALGLPEDDALRKRIETRRSALFRRELPSLNATPGAGLLLDRLDEAGLRRFVASSSPEDQLRGLLEQTGLIDRVDGMTSADEVERAKPAPDIFTIAIRKAGERPATSIAVGDTPYDLEAARRACVGLVALRCGGWTFEAHGARCVTRLVFPKGEPEVEVAAVPLEVYADPGDLVAHWEASPLDWTRSGARGRASP